MSRQSDLRFTFEPLKGDPFEVVSFTLREGVSEPFKLELELASHNAAIDFNRVLDLSGLFTIWRGETPVRYVHGLVSLFQQGDTGFPPMRGDPDAPVKTVQTSYWELHCRMQDGAGDGTVPVSSGSAPIKHARNGEVRQQVKAPGFDHEASYANPLAQHFTLYSLIKIAAKAKRPLCVS